MNSPPSSLDVPDSDRKASLPSRMAQPHLAHLTAIHNPHTGKKTMIDTNTLIALMEKIHAERKASGEIFTRRCPSCSDENPLQRVACTPCGHVICSKCADETNDCPICKKLGNIAIVFIKHVHLYEDDHNSRECSICLIESPPRRVVMPNCGHIVCFTCSRRLQFCPFCCAPFGDNDDWPIHLVEYLVTVANQDTNGRI